ncbi:MAG: phage portal protein [Elusimicrobia bacterium]|nr:phage portal protein [Elusimicrobiota bacterium]
MAAKGGIETKIEPGLIARAIRGVRYAFTGQADWFGPGQPLNPSAPEVIEGRQYDLPISVNSFNSTKTEGITFQQLRNFADACDLVRLLIETRKDQVCGLSWVIKAKDGTSKPNRLIGKAAPKSDKRIDDLTAFFRKPDKDRCWSDWLRMVLEDMFVLDAPSIYIQRTNGGAVYALRPIDGSTIKRIIDTHGWTPAPPDPAYQQILKGTIALNYTTEELIYRPRNPRTNRIYGFGHVEQIIVTAKLLLSRQASNLEYYETGNLPEGWITVAEGWTPQQLKEYQDILDAQLSGNLAERRKARAAPAGSKWQPVKEPALKNDYDEWLARIACFAFSYPPTPFIKQMNRSTSDKAKESADEEGVQPITRWIKELLDDIIQTRMGFPDLEFTFEDKEAQDPLERAQIDQIYVDSGVLEPNEVREEMGLDPLPEPEESEPVLTTLDAPVGNAPQPAANAPAPNAKVPPKAQKVAKMAPPDGTHQHADTNAETAAETKLADELRAAFELTSESVAEQVAQAESRGNAVLDAQALADQVDLTPIAEAEKQLVESIQASAQGGAQSALTELSIGDADLTKLVNTRAVDWAKRRAADLIKSDGTGGELIDATRNLIRSTIEQAAQEGWSARTLSNELQDTYAFSRDRAMTIARTELAMAYSNGAMQGYIASGVVKGKKWILDPDPCPVCRANAAQGEIPLLQAFQGGVMTSPQHPRCRCTVAPIVED